MWSEICDLRFLIRDFWSEISYLILILWSEICDLWSEIWTLWSEICDLRYVIWDMWSKICDLISVIWYLWFVIWDLRSLHWARDERFLWSYFHKLFLSLSFFSQKSVWAECWKEFKFAIDIRAGDTKPAEKDEDSSDGSNSNGSSDTKSQGIIDLVFPLSKQVN